MRAAGSVAPSAEGVRIVHHLAARPRHHRGAARLRALGLSELEALTDGRRSGGFTPEATVAARRANALELSG